uniref:Uncharacterized protein n=1 Tax=Macrostomum lignano TaxID=282301 RepID=A0A1I8INT6_9PLAT
MGSAASRALLDCCPTGALATFAEFAGRFRRSDARRRWGGGGRSGGSAGSGRVSRGSCCSAAALAADGHRSGAGEAGDDDKFVPLKAAKASGGPARAAVGGSRQPAGGYTNYGATDAGEPPEPARKEAAEELAAKSLSRKCEPF